MPTASLHDRSHVSLWRLLNRPHRPEPDTMRLGCGALFVVYAIVVVMRSQETGGAFLGFRVGMLLTGLLVAAGGVVGLVGIRNPPGAQPDRVLSSRA